MFSSISSAFRFRFIMILSVILLAVTLGSAQAQTNARCTFKLFQLYGTNGQGDRTLGIDRYGTVVGQALFPHAKSERGFIRFANGGVKYYRPPHSVFTTITGQNDNGVIVGEYAPANFPEGFMRNGSTFTSIVHAKSGSPYGTAVNGVNKLNTVVGYYIDNINNYKARGFERYSSGVYAALDYPNGTGTVPMGINDSGTVVGFFTTPKLRSMASFTTTVHGQRWITLILPERRN